MITDKRPSAPRRLACEPPPIGHSFGFHFEGYWWPYCEAMRRGVHPEASRASTTEDEHGLAGDEPDIVRDKALKWKDAESNFELTICRFRHRRWNPSQRRQRHRRPRQRPLSSWRLVDRQRGRGLEDQPSAVRWPMCSRTTSTSSIGSKEALSAVEPSDQDGDVSPACHARRIKWPPAAVG